MLKITTDGRKAALDLRLVDPSAVFTYQSKVARCAENVADIYFKTDAEKSAQIIFCDTSTPKADFNIYDEVKTLLVGMGLPEDKIAFVHDADTDARRNTLFARVRKGDIRVLLGSTFKLGIGVNVQDRLIALHHIDVPWRPADMTRREGRILRQGNLNPKVQIFRYITEGSFDAYSWQLPETKQRFIADLLSGTLTQRSGSDIEDTVLDYAEVKALAVGNPLVKERVETANELSRCLTLQRKPVESRISMETELPGMPGKKANQEKTIAGCEEDIAFYTKWKRENTAPDDSKAGKDNAEQRKRLREFFHSSLFGYVLEPQEKVLMMYRGFEIILPANMTREKPYIWLKRNGRYYAEPGDTDTGNLIRIDHFIDDLQTHLDKLKEDLAKLRERGHQLINEPKKSESFSDKIEDCRQKLEIPGKKLGVNKK